MFKSITSFCIGFTSGVIYTSVKFDQNPNTIFKSWGKKANKAYNNAKDKINDLTDSVKSEINSKRGNTIVKKQYLMEGINAVGNKVEKLQRRKVKKMV